MALHISIKLIYHLCVSDTSPLISAGDAFSSVLYQNERCVLGRQLEHSHKMGFILSNVRDRNSSPVIIGPFCQLGLPGHLQLP